MAQSVATQFAVLGGVNPIEAKDRMRARGMASPDEWDAEALTFAEPVAELSHFNRPLEYRPYSIA